MIIFKRILISLFIILLFNNSFLFAIQKDQSRTTIEVIGDGIIVENDVDKARDEAIKDALSTAVEQTVSKLLSAEQIKDNFQLLSDKIYNPIQKYIKGFRIVVEAQSGEFYRILVRTTVSIQALMDDFNENGISLSKKKKPIVIFFITEQIIDRPDYSWWISQTDAPISTYAETAMAQQFKEMEFDIISRRTLLKQINNNPAFQKKELDDKVIIEFGKQHNAEIIVVGHANAKPTSGLFGTSMTSFDGSVTARAFMIKTGFQIAQTAQQAKAVNINVEMGCGDSISQAAKMAAKELGYQITSGIKKESAKPSVVELIITGTKQLGYFVNFRRILSNDIPGVKAIRLKELKANQAKIEVDYPESANSLAKALMVKDFDTFGINITEISIFTIRLTLLSKEELNKTSLIEETELNNKQ